MINFKYKFNKKQIYFVADDPSITLGNKYKLKFLKQKIIEIFQKSILLKTLMERMY